MGRSTEYGPYMRKRSPDWRSGLSLLSWVDVNIDFLTCNMQQSGPKMATLLVLRSATHLLNFQPFFHLNLFNNCQLFFRRCVNLYSCAFYGHLYKWIGSRVESCLHDDLLKRIWCNLPHFLSNLLFIFVRYLSSTYFSSDHRHPLYLFNHTIPARKP